MHSVSCKRLLLAVLVLFPFFLLAQPQKAVKPDRYKGKKRANIGFAYNLMDSDPSVPIKDSIYGFSAMFWHGLSRKFDLSVRYNGLFSNKINNTLFGNNKNKMRSEFEFALHGKLLRDWRPLNLFLTGGVGIGNYTGDRWTRYEVGGGGLQINFKSDMYLLVQANYRYSLDEKVLPSNMLYSFGITRSIYSKKTKKPVIHDRDKDGVPDNEDECPDSAGVVALKGCPDRDGDGIPDKDDKCPDTKGVSRYGGCPPPDTDKDGISDEEDKCPTVFGVARYQGCPVPDTDGDGVNDEEDKCPAIKGTKENFGCPVISTDVKKKVNVAAKSILFVTASAELQAKSFKGLNDVVKIMKENPAMKLSIDGFTDSVGTEEHNQLLSDNRANAVKAYIVSKGIDESRITATGHGELLPVADNGTAAGRQRNRRVEMTLSYYQ